MTDVWGFPGGAAAARSQVLGLLLRIGSIERGGRAGVALSDHVDGDDAEGHTSIDLQSQDLESKRLLSLRYELSVLLPITVVLSSLNDVPRNRNM